MPKAADHAGRRFGSLVAVARDGHIVHGGQRKIAWACRCDCGNSTRVHAGALTSGQTRSCGCLGGGRTHGASDTAIYGVWHAMRQRCLNPSDATYQEYGGRGISVCQAWGDFARFLSDMGPRPEGYTLDRIDNDGPYSPENCRWAPPVVQANNRRSNVAVTAFGETLTLAKWARRAGITSSCLRHRLKSGWTPEDAVSRPSSRSLNNGKRCNLRQVLKGQGGHVDSRPAARTGGASQGARA